MILSILIPTIPAHAEQLKRLQYDLNRQILLPSTFAEIEILIDDRGPSVSTGEKRNYLIHQSCGDYIVFIDSDDKILDNYIESILFSCHHINPDCITFNGYMTTDGANRENFVIKLGEKYEKRDGVYYRWPNHLCPMKRELIKDIKFPHTHFGEDYEWSKRIKDADILKTSVHIEDDLYHYDYKSKPSIPNNIRQRRNWKIR